MNLIDKDGRKVVLLNGVWYRVEAGRLVRFKDAPDVLEALLEEAARGHA